jgi:hypothetical protein
MVIQTYSGAFNFEHVVNEKVIIYIVIMQLLRSTTFFSFNAIYHFG